jgi:exopolysaccharide production protein ExoZ
VGKIRSLQILRFVAALLVVSLHAHVSAAGRLYEVGNVGVDVFFVISGFVITLTGPLAERRPTGARFFWLRWSRVAPFFWLMSAPWIFGAAVAGILNWSQIAATFLFWPGLSNTVAPPTLFVGWTLCLEMMFYSAVSLGLIGGNWSRSLKIGGAVVVAVLLARGLGWHAARGLVNPLFVEFGFGMGLAYAWPWLRRRSLTLGAAMIGLCLCLFLVGVLYGLGQPSGLLAVVLNGDKYTFRVVTCGIPSALLVAGALICEPWAKGRWSEPFVRLGDSSYSLYLVHPFVLVATGEIWRLSSLSPLAGIMAIAELALCIAAGWVVHLYIEKPILRDVRALGTRVVVRLRRRPAFA